MFLLRKWIQTRRLLWEFPIGSYVELSSAVVTILVGVLKCWTQFWKGTTQESFQQSLVEIGSVVSEEKIFFKFHPPFFAHLAFRPCELLSSLFVRRPSVNISHFNLLLRNHWANCNHTLVEWSLDGPLPKLCPLLL
jgi:hypothetical protein